MAAESPTRQWMDMHGYIICDVEERSPQEIGRFKWGLLNLGQFLRFPLGRERLKPVESKLSVQGLTPDEIATIRSPLLVSKPWRYMVPIYRPNLYDPIEAWRAVLEPLGIFEEAKKDMEPFYQENPPFLDPNLPEDATDEERMAQYGHYFNETFNNYILPRANRVAIETMSIRDKRLNLLSSFVYYKLPSLVYAFERRYLLWEYLSHEPITGFTRLNSDVPITFYKVFALHVGMELMKKIDSEEIQEVGEDDRLNGMWQAAVNKVHVFLNGIDLRKFNTSPLAEQVPPEQDQWRGLITDHKGLPHQAGIHNRDIRRDKRMWNDRFKGFLP